MTSWKAPEPWRACLLAMPLLSGHAGAEVFPREDIITDPDPDRFSVCFNHGCESVATLSLTDAQWNAIARHFRPPARTAAGERRQVRAAIAEFETLVGAMTGTGRDIGGVFPGLGRPGQMDCIDESVNSTTYLRMLHGRGLLRWHRVGDRATRGFFLFGWPHTTAVLEQRDTGERYAVDSWFFDNGAPPAIVSLKEWKDGWRPPR